jgi:hypothetical protein
MRGGWRRIGMMALGVLALLGGAGALRPAPARAQEPPVESNCRARMSSFGCPIDRTDERGASGREARRCTGPTVLNMIRADRHLTRCQEILAKIDCAGHMVKSRPLSLEGPNFCPTANLAWSDYCELSLGSGMGRTGGACAWRDYYGTVIRLEVRVPPHRFRIAPYPVGFVAREDPWGVFHPTARLVWEEPPWPQHADSGWRLWTWGNSRGPGSAAFPCDMSEADLLARGVPEGTTCVRIRIWTAPGFDNDLNPVMVPGLLAYPAARLYVELPPGRTVELNFPYASHPATGEVSEVSFGGQTLPAFNGYFQRWWPARFRVEWRKVKDITGTRTVCDPLPRERFGEQDCWTTIGDPPAAWPGRSRTETYVERKEWEGPNVRDGILDLSQRPFDGPYAYLHPDEGWVEAPGGSWRISFVLQGSPSTPWLYLPLAVREGQGAVTR